VVTWRGHLKSDGTSPPKNHTGPFDIQRDLDMHIRKYCSFLKMACTPPPKKFQPDEIHKVYELATFTGKKMKSFMKTVKKQMLISRRVNTLKHDIIVRMLTDYYQYMGIAC